MVGLFLNTPLPLLSPCPTVPSQPASLSLLPPPSSSHLAALGLEASGPLLPGDRLAAVALLPRGRMQFASWAGGQLSCEGLLQLLAGARGGQLLLLQIERQVQRKGEGEGEEEGPGVQRDRYVHRAGAYCLRWGPELRLLVKRQWTVLTRDHFALIARLTTVRAAPADPCRHLLSRTALVTTL